MYWCDDRDGDGVVFCVHVYAMFLGNFLVGAVIGERWIMVLVKDCIGLAVIVIMGADQYMQGTR